MRGGMKSNSAACSALSMLATATATCIEDDSRLSRAAGAEPANKKAGRPLAAGRWHR